MNTLLQCLLVVGKYVVAWFALPHHVERIRRNHLPHLYKKIEENAVKIDAIESKVDKQAGRYEGMWQALGVLLRRNGIEPRENPNPEE